MKWEELPFRERVGYIRVGVKNGLRSLEDVKNAYHSYYKELINNKDTNGQRDKLYKHS